MTWKTVSTGVLALILLASCVEVQNNPQFSNWLNQAAMVARPLDNETVAAGLREALRVGSERAASSASKADGFLANEAIRIELPESMDRMTGMLRTVGLGSLVDSFQVRLNRAAEAAAEEAVPVFSQAVKEMSLTDVMSILHGSDTAATDYFSDKTSFVLAQRFKPVIRQNMEQVGLYSLYAELVQAYETLPLADKRAINLEDYLTEKTRDGLFYLLAREEEKIRRDPAARTTELLKKVFE
ncbi:MAG: DUF4197 domain-containing protein [Desulfuromonadaceae bacterium]|nr:DUF4197 domain-containing protein [Desulfuromonadaceae bacterium]